MDLIIRNARLASDGAEGRTVDIGVRDNVVQRYGAKDLAVCVDMITGRAAKLMRLDDYGIAVGKSADLVVWAEERPSDIIAKCALPLAGFKRGRQIFSREMPTLPRPG